MEYEVTEVVTKGRNVEYTSKHTGTEKGNKNEEGGGRCKGRRNDPSGV